MIKPGQTYRCIWSERQIDAHYTVYSVKDDVVHFIWEDGCMDSETTAYSSQPTPFWNHCRLVNLSERSEAPKRSAPITKQDLLDLIQNAYHACLDDKEFGTITGYKQIYNEWKKNL
jgi:hypothetical protein